MAPWGWRWCTRRAGWQWATQVAGRALDMDAAAAGAAEVARAAIGTLQKDDTIQDIMITLGKQYHVIRFLRPGSDMFLCRVLDRERTSLGMARHRLAQLARRMRA